MYNKDQYWYKYWSKHITNLKEVESKCINHLGVSFDQYFLNMWANIIYFF